MIHLFVGCCVGAVVVLMTSEAMGWVRIRALSKTIASLSFVGYAVGLGAFDHGLGGLALIAGLGLSLIGDLCLLSDEKRIFKAGILAFLVAHIAYVVLFVILGVHWTWVGAGVITVGLLAIVIGRVLAPYVGSLKGAVYAYIAVISVMVAMAIGMGAFESGPGRVGLLMSAIAFFLSDLCVARQRFMTPGLINKAFGLPLYFGAQLGFAWYGVQVLGA